MLLAATVESVSAGEPAGPVAKSILTEMGLGGMQVMSPQQGLAVRGKFTRVRVYGPTYDVTRLHFAARTNFSSAGGGFSGGGSSARAH
jgi:hypothetical protein